MAQGADKRGGKPQAGRQSVAAVRQTSVNSNRTQLIIGAIAILAILGVVVGAVVMNKDSTAKPVEGYGPSTQSVATWNDTVVTVDNGTEPALTIDVFQDPICTHCRDFEHQYGEQINQAVDQGKLRVNYHTVTFLDSRSASGDYSSRAAGALQCVASDTSVGKGGWMQFMSRLFADGTLPAMGGSADLSNADLAAIAAEYGVSGAGQQCIADGAGVPEAQAGNEAGQQRMLDTVGQIGTPLVLKDGQPQPINETDWLTTLLG